MLGQLHAWFRTHRLSELDRTAVVAVLLFVILSSSFLAVKDATYFGDEGYHFEQIEYFLDGQYRVTSSLTTIPGYHVVMALASRMMGEESIVFYRTVNLLFAFASIVVFFLTAQAIHKKTSLAKTFQYVFLPILFPFFFLLYTDVLSLLLMLLALLAYEKRNVPASAVFAALSVIVRQNNIVWFAFLFAAMLPHVKASDISRKEFIESAVLFGIGFILFAVFMQINGGIAIGDKGSHPFPSLHLGNVYFLLFLCGILFLPMHLGNLRNIFRELRSNRFAPAILVAFFVVGMLTFVSTHGYNQGLDSVFLRNKILSYFTLTPLLKTLFFIPTTLAFLSLLVTPLRKPVYYLLYPATVLYLLPSWLIEQRYYFIPFVFFLLFRREQSKTWEWLTVAYSATLTGFVYWMVATRWLFL